MSTKFCPQCGKELPQESVFCPYCMTKFIETKKPDAHPVTKKKTVLIILIIAIAVLAVAGIIAFVVSRLPSSDSQPDQSASTIAATTENVDYSRYIGLWCDKGKTEDQITYDGGNLLEIVSVKDDVIRFNFTKISSPANNRIARLDNVACQVIDGVGTFSFDDDNWQNSGTGKIKLTEDEIYLETNITNASEDAMWDIGGSFYLSKSESSTIDFESYTTLGADFNSVKNHFGEQTADVQTAADKWNIYSFSGFSVTTLIETDEIVSINVDYASSLSKSNVCYGSINGNSTYDDVYSKFGEPTYNSLSAGNVSYNIAGGSVEFKFNDNMIVTGFNITANDTH